MREIKFRAWDTEEKVMYEDNRWIGNYDDLYLQDINDIFAKEPEVVFMQFTGLLDKNGKEICCGDIVKGWFQINDVDDSTYLSLTPCEILSGEKLFKIDMDIVEFARQYLPDELEVIGNVFENSELISK